MILLVLCPINSARHGVIVIYPIEAGTRSTDMQFSPSNEDSALNSQ